MQSTLLGVVFRNKKKKKKTLPLTHLIFDLFILYFVDLKKNNYVSLFCLYSSLVPSFRKMLYVYKKKIVLFRYNFELKLGIFESYNYFYFIIYCLALEGVPLLLISSFAVALSMLRNCCCPGLAEVTTI